MPFPRETADYDKASMPQNMLLSDSLEDLANLRKQLYSAAEYFELSYINDDQKQIVANTLKDYAIKALVSTVDHLGSVTYKANDMLDEKVVEVSGTELRISCVEQRLRTCQEYIDREGLSQQSLVINTPKYCKRYILPVGETRCGLDDEDVRRHFQNAVEATTTDIPESTVGNEQSPSPSPQLPQQSRSSFSISITMPKKELGPEKRTVSPHRFRHLRTASLPSRPTTPKSSRPTTPNRSRPPTPTPRSQLPYTSEPRKPMPPLHLHAERENTRDSDHHRPSKSKSKRLLKALLSRRKSKNDDMLYTYLDEY
ncbi:protein ABIL3-like [Ipomoea triloba]|uniref:protein ABIL3-like n=1 Tax=Ipomoea triloba TaxID=35885 RepID=UPI00125E9B2E|nr:protein ABIL3-like [Ipomoea triloba]XP_031109602.1 protein ABIL3-like [Ipomoea triloba]XP_031109603.1 protein ABIL3-like [Ipomoea triloba]XP_031109604.1 protein ABIL3-like [Ipomoea triloba]